MQAHKNVTINFLQRNKTAQFTPKEKRLYNCRILSCMTWRYFLTYWWKYHTHMHSHNRIWITVGGRMFAGVVLLDLLSGRNNTCAAWFLLCINLALIMKKSNRFYCCMSNRVSNSSRFVRQQWKWSFQYGVRVLKCKLHFVRGAWIETLAIWKLKIA